VDGRREGAARLPQAALSIFTLHGGTIVRIDEFKTRDEALGSVRVATAADETEQSDRLQPASTPVAAQRAMVQRVVPILNVTDIGESFAWFGKLGWRKGFQWNPEASDAAPGFGSVESGECARSSCAVTAKAAAAPIR
jgi:hypothetical protein